VLKKESTRYTSSFARRLRNSLAVTFLLFNGLFLFPSIARAEDGLTAEVYNVLGQNNAPVLPANAQPILVTQVPNVDFDWGALGKPDVKRICTLALARRLWPDTDSHSQSALMYYLFGATTEVRETLRNAHSAGSDVKICSYILERILDEMAGDGDYPTIEELYEFSEDARVPHIMPFGKHKGEPVSSVPKAYADWYRRQENPDPYILMAFQRNKK